jgi:hypothetical protein
LSNPQWKDKDGNDTNKGLVGEIIKLCVDCNSDMDEGAGVVFSIYSNDKEKITELSTVNKNGKAETEWIYQYEYNPNNPLTEKPRFTFKAKTFRGKEIESRNIKIGMTYHIIGKMHDGKPMANINCTIHLSGNILKKTTSNINGEIIIEDEIPGSVLMVEYIDKDNQNQIADTKEF